MKWSAFILSLIAAINMVAWPVVAQTQGARNSTPEEGHRLVVEANKAVLYDKATGRPLAEVPHADQKQLRRFSPRSLNQMLQQEMARVNTSSKAAFAHSLKALPTESLVFFFAMGAVVAGQLLLNYSQNPLAMKQHIDHHMSPLGVFGFFTFMFSQGVTANMLSMYITNPKFHHMIPYMGMAVGAFTQTYLTSVMGDPNVLACAKTWLGQKVTDKDLKAGVDENPCDQAYEYLVVNKKLWEFAPGITSMLLSAGLAGLGQSVISKAVLRITGVDIAMYLMPGAMQLKGIRLLLVKGLQISAFVGIDVWINRSVTTSWKNFFDGNDFYDMNVRLNTQMNRLKSSQWQGSEKELDQEIKLLRKKSSEWRMTNLSAVYEAHQSWSENIQRLMSMYNASYSFYDSLIDEARSAQAGQSHVQGLNISYPFNGVKAKGLVEGKEDLYFTAPKFVEPMQIETIADTVALIDALPQTYPQYQGIYPQERRQLKKIRDLLARPEVAAKVQGLTELNTVLQYAFKSTASSRFFIQVLYSIKSHLGQPDPMMEPGRGFLANYEISPAHAENLKGLSYYRRVGLFQTPRATDYLLMQMICGPDAERGQSVVRNSTGFLSIFLPPQIHSSASSFEQECHTVGREMPAKMIYHWPVKKNGKSYVGFLDYLKNNIRPQVMSDFTGWWRSTTDQQMKASFDNFSQQYSVIIGELIDGLHRTDKNAFNRGPIANGALDSALQEQRIYLSILAELLQPQGPFNIRFEDALNEKPKIESLREVERQFQILFSLLSRIKVVKYLKETRIHSDIENFQLENQLERIQTALKTVSEQLGVDEGENAQALIQINERQRNIAVTTLENIQSLATELMMYGSIANAVTWEKIRDLKRVDIEQQQFDNSVQAKMKSMLLTGAR